MSSKYLAFRFIGLSPRIPDDFKKYLASISMLCTESGELNGGMYIGDTYVQYSFNADPEKKVKKFSGDINIDQMTAGNASAELRSISIGATFAEEATLSVMFDAVNHMVNMIPTAKIDIDENNRIAFKNGPFVHESPSGDPQNTTLTTTEQRTTRKNQNQNKPQTGEQDQSHAEHDDRQLAEQGS